MAIVPHLTAFGWPIATMLFGRYPLDKAVPIAARGLGWDIEPAPGTLVFDAIAHGLHYLDAKYSLEENNKVFRAGTQTAIRHWRTYRPWERKPSEGFQEPNFGSVEAEFAAANALGATTVAALV